MKLRYVLQWWWSARKEQFAAYIAVPQGWQVQAILVRDPEGNLKNWLDKDGTYDEIPTNNPVGKLVASNELTTPYPSTHGKSQSMRGQAEACD